MKINGLEERMRNHASVTKNIISPPFDLKMELEQM